MVEKAPTNSIVDVLDRILDKSITIDAWARLAPATSVLGVSASIESSFQYGTYDIQRRSSSDDDDSSEPLTGVRVPLPEPRSPRSSTASVTPPITES